MSWQKSLDAANLIFHEAYGARRDDASAEVPVLVLLADQLVVQQGAERRSVPFSCPAFSSAKSAAHIAVALFATTCHGEFDAAARARLDGLLGRAVEAEVALAQGARDALTAEVLALLELCRAYGEEACTANTAEQRARFARLAGERILRLTELATREQVARLHEAVNAALAPLSRAEQAHLQVVVAGDHQARARSLGMQYFQRRLAEPAGSDERVTYGENISSADEAITLVGTRRLDQLIARAFFGDEKRLQRDVLGDAARACLERMDVGQEAKT